MKTLKKFLSMVLIGTIVTTQASSVAAFAADPSSGRGTTGRIPGAIETCESLKSYRDGDLVAMWDRASGDYKRYKFSVELLADYEKAKADLLDDTKWQRNGVADLVGGLILGTKLAADTISAVLSALPGGFVVRVNGRIALKALRSHAYRVGVEKVAEQIQAGQTVAGIVQDIREGEQSSEELVFDALALVNPVVGAVNDLYGLAEDLKQISDFDKSSKEIKRMIASQLGNLDRKINALRSKLEATRDAGGKIQAINSVKNGIDKLLHNYCSGKDLADSENDPLAEAIKSSDNSAQERQVAKYLNGLGDKMAATERGIDQRLAEIAEWKRQAMADLNRGAVALAGFAAPNPSVGSISSASDSRPSFCQNVDRQAAQIAGNQSGIVSEELANLKRIGDLYKNNPQCDPGGHYASLGNSAGNTQSDWTDPKLAPGKFAPNKPVQVGVPVPKQSGGSTVRDCVNRPIQYRCESR